jgi:hypothetical protein
MAARRIHKLQLGRQANQKLNMFSSSAVELAASIHIRREDFPSDCLILSSLRPDQAPIDNTRRQWILRSAATSIGIRNTRSYPAHHGY